MSPVSPAFALLAGGGTAGHVSPSLAVAHALVERGHGKDSIWFVGSDTGMERALVEAAGYPIETLPVWNFPRRITARHVIAAAKMAWAVVAAVRIVRRLRPKVVVSFGGFASVAPVIAAKLGRVPIVVVSFDAVPGSASRLAARWARACAVAFADSPLPRKVHTGAPVREDIALVDRVRDREAARAELALPVDRFCVLVVGGSLGAGRLNAAVRSFVDANVDRADLAVRHVVGARFLAESLAARPSTSAEKGLLYQVVGYDDRIDVSYAAADLVICRAGANTVHEIAAVGVPAVFVPWPGAAHDEQRANAASLVSRGAARLVDDHDFDAERLGAEIARAMADRAALEAMGARARALSVPDAAEGIAGLIERSVSR